MAIKEYSIFPKAPVLLEPHYHIFSVISRTLVWGVLLLCRPSWLDHIYLSLFFMYISISFYSYVCMYVCLSLSLSLYIYIYIYRCSSPDLSENKRRNQSTVDHRLKALGMIQKLSKFPHLLVESNIRYRFNNCLYYLLFSRSKKSHKNIFWQSSCWQLHKCKTTMSWWLDLQPWQKL